MYQVKNVYSSSSSVFFFALIFCLVEEGGPAFTTAFLATEEGLAALRPRGIVGKAIDGAIEVIDTSSTMRVNEEKQNT
jgi:hypothetical protein